MNTKTFYLILSHSVTRASSGFINNYNKKVPTDLQWIIAIGSSSSSPPLTWWRTANPNKQNKPSRDAMRATGRRRRRRRRRRHASKQASCGGGVSAFPPRRAWGHGRSRRRRRCRRHDRCYWQERKRTRHLLPVRSCSCWSMPLHDADASARITRIIERK